MPNIAAMCSVLVALLLTVLASQLCPDTGRVPVPQFCFITSPVAPLSPFLWGICANDMGQLKCFSVISFFPSGLFWQNLLQAWKPVTLSGQQIWGWVAKSWELPESCNFFTSSCCSQDGPSDRNQRHRGSYWKLVWARPEKACGIYVISYRMSSHSKMSESVVCTALNVLMCSPFHTRIFLLEDKNPSPRVWVSFSYSGQYSFCSIFHTIKNSIDGVLTYQR